jgi:hypothetical protein
MTGFRGPSAGDVAAADAPVALADSPPRSADERWGWRTLPRKIVLFRADLPPGRYDFAFEFVGGDDVVVSVDYLYGVEVRAGDWSFFNRRVF